MTLKLGRRLVMAGALLMAIAVAADVQAQDDHGIAIRVEALLSAGIEPSNAEARIVALGESGERALRTVFERVAAPSYVRLRALAAMPAFPTEATARYLAALVHAAQQPIASDDPLHPARSSLVLRRALEGLRTTRSDGVPRPDVTAVALCLAHADAHVRKAAAELLATLNGQDVQVALTTQLVRERSRMVRGKLERALSAPAR